MTHVLLSSESPWQRHDVIPQLTRDRLSNLSLTGTILDMRVGPTGTYIARAARRGLK